ncbi:RNA 2',3'-cyclic phosphodiesterase [Candidatus Parcubacteria bacterium]|nr:MAG: RNA 2',3'-cyclic phosphodiesterase [Candidatus Parcubacteria bacterium]
MERRIFIAIELPPDLKAKLAELIQQWRWLPLRWIPEEQWHVTVIPPVGLDDAQCDALVAALRNARLGGAFSFRFDKIMLAPPNQPSRMIWLSGPTPPELGKLAERIGEIWKETSGMPPFEADERERNAHVTLARFEPGALTELEVKMNVLEEVRLVAPVGEVSVMESERAPGGARYMTIATIPV